MTIANKWDLFKAKVAGARKSLTVWIIAAWQAVVQNIDTIKEVLPQTQQYFGDHLFQIVSVAFGVLLICVRLFHTSEPVEDKVSQ